MTQDQVDTVSPAVAIAVTVGVIAAAIGFAPATAVIGLAALTEITGYAIVAGLYSAFMVGHLFGPQEETNVDDLTNCFPKGTLITLDDGSAKAIEHIRCSDHVLAFDAFGELVPRRVIQVFQNITDCWLELSFEASDRMPLIVTPGHRFLAADGGFEPIERLLQQGSGRATVVLADGSLASVRGKLIAFSEADRKFFRAKYNPKCRIGRRVSTGCTGAARLGHLQLRSRGFAHLCGRWRARPQRQR